MKRVGVTDYTNHTPSKFNTPPLLKKRVTDLQITQTRTDGRAGGEDPLLDLYFAKATHVIK